MTDYTINSAGSSTTTFPENLEVGDKLIFNNTGTGSTGSSMLWELPVGMTVKLKCWGAEGGGASTAHRGQGGYAEGQIELKSGTELHIYVGNAGIYGHGTSGQDGGWNGGGQSFAGNSSYGGSSGGGASDIRCDGTALADRIIVAGGGGGGSGNGSTSWRCSGGGAGGGGYYGGGGGHGGSTTPSTAGQGGTQSAGGTGGGTSSGSTTGSLGMGADGGNSTYTSTFSSSGNSFGGDGGGTTGSAGYSLNSTRASGGGGGSSYVGHEDLTETSTLSGEREGHGLVEIEILSIVVAFTIKGKVTLNSTNVEGAKVRLINDTTNEYVGDTLTDASGDYEFEVSSDTNDYHAVVEYQNDFSVLNSFETDFDGWSNLDTCDGGVCSGQAIRSDDWASDGTWSVKLTGIYDEPVQRISKTVFATNITFDVHKPAGKGGGFQIFKNGEVMSTSSTGATSAQTFSDNSYNIESGDVIEIRPWISSVDTDSPIYIDNIRYTAVGKYHAVSKPFIKGGEDE